MVRRIARWLGIAALVIGYPLLAHYTNKYPHDGTLGALVAMMPVSVLALALAWRSPQRARMLSLLVMACVVLWAEWSTLKLHFGLVYWLQDVGIQLMLFMTFARTLFADRQPLCTRFAEAVHAAPLTPEHKVYARQVTVAWAIFFAVMSLVSTLLFFMAPINVWSIFANFLMLPLVAAMFILEYWVRRWLLPDAQNTRILDAVHAFKNAPVRPR